MTLSPLDAADLVDRVRKHLTVFLDTQLPLLGAIAGEVAGAGAALADFVLDGGKRMRPAFCYWGWRGAGAPDDEPIVAAAASLELLHACALVHDDVMDESDTRRGRPAMHRRFAALHQDNRWYGDPVAFGRAAAILLGDLALVWADQMFHSAGLPAAAVERAVPLYDEMRVELMAGQYLDVLEQVRGTTDPARSLRVARYKAAKYTIERPLQLGGLLAGGPPELLARYSAYGVPLGEAFQLRDDVLGVYGDPAETGKPAGDDLREGKRTLLVALTLERATAAEEQVVLRLLGRPDLDGAGVDTLREVIAGTGALAQVERQIEALAAQALAALDGTVAADARVVLAELTGAATARRG